jgi:protein phosphatase 1 regulatory subunit 11
MAFTATQPGPSTSAPGDASRTLTITDAAPRTGDAEASTNPDGSLGVLRLRGARNRQRVAWDEDVVDNEGCGKKSSKSERIESGINGLMFILNRVSMLHLP